MNLPDFENIGLTSADISQICIFFRQRVHHILTDLRVIPDYHRTSVYLAEISETIKNFQDILIYFANDCRRKNKQPGGPHRAGLILSKKNKQPMLIAGRIRCVSHFGSRR